jgi:hypothetical protein
MVAGKLQSRLNAAGATVLVDADGTDRLQPMADSVRISPREGP